MRGDNADYGPGIVPTGGNRWQMPAPGFSIGERLEEFPNDVHAAHAAAPMTAGGREHEMARVEFLKENVAAWAHQDKERG